MVNWNSGLAISWRRASGNFIIFPLEISLEVLPIIILITPYVIDDSSEIIEITNSIIDKSQFNIKKDKQVKEVTLDLKKEHKKHKHNKRPYH